MNLSRPIIPVIDSKHLLAVKPLVLAVAVLICAGLPAAQGREPPAAASAALANTSTPQLVRFKAHLFNRESGAFSPDVLARDAKGAPMALANAVGGAFASDSTFVALEIRAPAGDIIAAGTRFRFKAIDTDELPFATTQRKPRPKVLVDQIVKTGRIAAGTSSFIGFWLPATGCAPVKLSAQWMGPGKPGTLTDTLAFVCHE